MNQKQVKRLPRDEKGRLLNRFPANGRIYRILDPEADGFSIERFNAWMKMGSVFGFGMGFAEQMQRNNEALNILEGVVERTHKFTDLALHLAAMRDGISKLANDRYSMAFHLCAIFIVREDEDLIHYDLNDPIVEEKISDWSEEGYNAEDFLALAADLVIGFRQNLNALTDKIEAKESGVFTGDTN